ncbi:UNVERIFIED_CONTAM: hypothetical protein K2H54_066898 [Gekko kuhli]
MALSNRFLWHHFIPSREQLPQELLTLARILAVKRVPVPVQPHYVPLFSLYTRTRRYHVFLLAEDGRYTFGTRSEVLAHSAWHFAGRLTAPAGLISCVFRPTSE